MHEGYGGSRDFTFNLTAYDSESGEVVFQEQTSDFEFDEKSFSILIEPDQSSYQPGDTRERSRSLCEFLRNF